ncbi:MAG: recombinase family protein, partial [bacterium]
MTENQKQEKPCAIYVRVSTQKQAEEGMSIESQIETLKHEAARRGKPVFEVYNDAGFSGGASNRPEFTRMLKDSLQKPPPFDLVLTWSISRFGRNTMESYIATEKMRERGITIFYHK